jgi:hypothetical protein
MARREIDDIRDEIELLKQKANFRRKDGEINKRYQTAYNNLLKEEKTLVDAITKSRAAEVKVGQASIKSAQDLQKAEDNINKSLSSRLQMLVKGNVLGAIGLGNSGKQATATRDLKKEYDGVVTEIKNSNIDITKQAQLIDIAGNIQSGNLTDEKNIQEQITGVGAKQSVNMSGILEKKSTETVLGAKNAKNLAMANKLLIGGGAIFAATLAIAQKFAGSIDAIGKQFGSLNVLGDGFKNELLTSQEAVIGIGASLEDVIATTNELSSEFGLSIDEAADLSAQVIDTARAVGLSNEEAAKLSGILQTTSGLSGAQAERLTEGAFQLAAMNKVNPSAVLKDMAGSSEAFAMFSEDGGDNMAKAAVQARALGLSLDTTSKIAEGLLDFENSINKEVEASVLIGKQLNFQKARELALDNDIEGAMSNIVNQLGSEAEFNKLNVIQRKALADSIGVSVADMAKMVANQDKSNMLAGETAKSFADIIGKDAMSELTATMNELKIFGVALANTVGPILMAVAKVVNFALTPLGDLVSGISQSVRGVNDFKSGPGGITTMMGPAGVFSLNPRDSVLATTNPIPVNDISMGPAGSKSVGGGNMNVTFGDATFQNDKLRLAVVNPPDTTRSL